MGIKCSVFIATSLDGYIARRDGGLDWLPGSDGPTSDGTASDGAGAEDHGYAEFYAAIDTLVMGRHTYELVRTFKPWPYSGKRVVVLSSAYPKMPMALAQDVEGTSESPRDLVQRLEASGAAHVYVDGGKTIQSFLNAGLIQELTITRVPVLIGEGIPLFGPLAHDIKLLHQATRAYANGLVQSTYRVGT